MGLILGSEDPLEKGMATQPAPVFLSGTSAGQRSLVCYHRWGPEESDTTEQLSVQTKPAATQETPEYQLLKT